jgi:hypothetical protein
MLNPSDMQPWLDQVKREIENTVFSPPDWIVDRLRNSLAEAIGKAIPKCFVESMHQIIEQSVEKSLSDVVSRNIEQGFEKAIRPLVKELALLRQALEKNLDDDWWKGDQESEPNDESKDDTPF